MLPTLKIQKKVKEDETYHCNWVERILNRQQENFIPTRWVISVPWPSDPLACGVVEEGLLPSNVHRFICCKCHTFLCTFHVFKLHQSLALERHHHDIAGEGNITLNFPAHSKQLPGPMMLIYDMFFSKQFLTKTYHMVPNFSRASTRSASTTDSHSPRTWTTGETDTLWWLPPAS